MSLRIILIRPIIHIGWQENGSKALPIDRVRQIIAGEQGEHRVYYSVEVYCPIVCVDAPMYTVEVDDNGISFEFKETNILLTSVRVAGWPWNLSADVAVLTPQAIVTVVNTSGLPVVLDDLRTYHASLQQSLRAADNEVSDRARLESDFITAIRQKYAYSIIAPI